MTRARPVSSSIRALAALALCSASLSGCLRTLTSEGELQKFGAIALKGVPTGPGNADAIGTAIFFEAYSATVPNSRGQSNSCQFAFVDTTTRTPTGQLQAGQTLSLQVGRGSNLRTGALNFEGSTTRYQSSAGVPYVAGDSVTVNIPGQNTGYPAGVVKLLLAEPLVVEDVTLPTAGGPMVVRWNASADTTTAVYLSLRYPNPPNSPYANEQVLCSLRDDGHEEIPGAALTPFNGAPASLRSLTVIRWRTNRVNPTDKSLLHIVSTTEMPAKFK